MFAQALIAAVMLMASVSESEEEEPRLRLDAYLDEFCIDAPEGSCDALYKMADAIERFIVRGATDAGMWCCESCGPGQLSDAKITCGGCAKTTESWKCGSVRFADQPWSLDCPGATAEMGGSVSCF
ncbi:hypothetical protein [Nannocystis punicea]|uniref:Uncharacterized protein n=1 Tax=Nannocystis punicea TaxID=2995304 RepID=A0ABY7GUR8_9BACT|nr:hypothetical protein [Nannocystis poenicansa]WAS90692.1 hypothetical protein O0S08_31275 [Nannocystis poenicansa]